MKFVAVLGSTLASMFISIAAQAVVLPDGSFAPDRCGAQTGLVGHVQSVCIGQVQGVQGEAIEFRLADKSTRVYKVIDQQNLMVAMLSGNTKSVLFLAGANGEKMTMKVITKSRAFKV